MKALTMFGYAARGLRIAYLEERNLRIHLVAAEFALTAAAYAHLSGAEFALVIFVTASVLAAETANAALERVVDLSRRYEPLAAAAKDLGAGFVLVTAAGAVAVGVALFGPRLHTVAVSAAQHWPVTLLILVLALVTLFGPRQRRRQAP